LAADPIDLVLLPGLDGTGRLFGPLLATAPTGHRPVVVGYPDTEELDLPGLVAYVSGHLPAGEWILVAESFSGPVGITLAAGRPPGLTGLVLVATAARWRRLRPVARVPLAGLLRLGVPGWAVRALLLGPEAAPDLVDLCREVIGRADPGLLAARIRLLARLDVGPELKRVEVPILYLQAGDDRLVDRRDRATILGVRPDIERRVVAGRHFLLQASPEACWRHIEAFAAVSRPLPGGCPGRGRGGG
jgi:pimeloyl-ACP methyl ester carboxylesterase